MDAAEERAGHGCGEAGRVVLSLNDVHRYTSNGEEAKYHIHSLVRIDAAQNDGYRYQCRVCGSRLKVKSGVMIDELKALIVAKSCSAESRRFQPEDGK